MTEPVRATGRNRGIDEEPPKRSVSLPIIIIVSAILGAVLSFMLINVYFMPKLVQKANYDTDITNIVGDIGKMQTAITGKADSSIMANFNSLNTQVAQLNDKVDVINQTVTTIPNGYASKTELSNAQASISDIKATITSIQTTINSMSPSVVADLQAKLTALDVRVTTAEATIKTLQTSTPSSSSGTPVIPNVTMTVSVPDEGTLQTSDNSTIGQLKITLVNSGTKDISDITLSLLVYFDDSANSNQSIVTSSYGTWSIRNRQVDEIELRGRLSTLNAGQTRRIYIDIKSYATNYQFGNRVTYLNTDNDITVMDWNYTN